MTLQLCPLGGRIRLWEEQAKTWYATPCLQTDAGVSVELGAAAGSLRVSDNEDLAGGSSLIPSLETTEALGDSDTPPAAELV